MHDCASEIKNLSKSEKVKNILFCFKCEIGFYDSHKLF